MPTLDSYLLDNYVLDGTSDYDHTKLKIHRTSVSSNGGVISKLPFKPIVIIAELYGVINNYIDTRDKLSLYCALVSYLTNTGEVSSFMSSSASGPNSSVQAFSNVSFGNDSVAISLSYYNGSYNNNVSCTILGF